MSWSILLSDHKMGNHCFKRGKQHVTEESSVKVVEAIEKQTTKSEGTDISIETACKAVQCEINLLASFLQTIPTPMDHSSAVGAHSDSNPFSCQTGLSCSESVRGHGDESFNFPFANPQRNYTDNTKGYYSPHNFTAVEKTVCSKTINEYSPTSRYPFRQPVQSTYDMNTFPRCRIPASNTNACIPGQSFVSDTEGIFNNSNSFRPQVFRLPSPELKPSPTYLDPGTTVTPDFYHTMNCGYFLNQCNDQTVPERAVSIPSLIQYTRPTVVPTFPNKTKNTEVEAAEHVQPIHAEKQMYQTILKSRLTRSFSCDTVTTQGFTADPTTKETLFIPESRNPLRQATKCSPIHYKVTPPSVEPSFLVVNDQSAPPLKLFGHGDKIYITKPPIQNCLNNHISTALYPELEISSTNAVKSSGFASSNSMMTDNENPLNWQKHLGFPQYLTSVFENGQHQMTDDQTLGISHQQNPVNQIIQMIPSSYVNLPETCIRGAECIMQFQPKILSRVSSMLIPSEIVPPDKNFRCQHQSAKTHKKFATDSHSNPKANGIGEKRLRSMSQTDVRRKHIKMKVDTQSVQNGFIYPRQPENTFKHRFFVKDSCGLEKVLSDPTDRRIRAICDKFQCDLEIYSKVPKNGYLQYVIDISSPSLCALNSCTRALDSSLHWSLSPQLPSTISAGSLNR